MLIGCINLDIKYRSRMFFQCQIHKLKQEHIEHLISARIPESLRLDYKETLDLNSKSDRKEVAKDISSFANTAGGRILWGIKEDKMGEDGIPDVITALYDESLTRRLEDIVLSSIHPRPRFRLAHIPIADGGFVLAMEVYASDYDLHMVDAYGDNRFYKRSEKRSVVMSEPEIRERYIRLAQERGAIEDRIEHIAEDQFSLRCVEGQSILVVPVFGRPGMFNPKLFDILKVRRELNFDPEHHGPLFDYMKITDKGYCSWLPYDGPPESASYYVQLQRDGIFHNADNGCFFSPDKNVHRFLTFVVCREILWSLKLANYLLEASGYWGPVRVFYRLVSHYERTVVSLDPFEFPTATLPVGTFNARSWYNTSEGFGSELAILNELLDQIWQFFGRRECPWFKSHGVFKEDAAAKLTFIR